LRAGFPFESENQPCFRVAENQLLLEPKTLGLMVLTFSTVHAARCAKQPAERLDIGD
jgi:hypothetical protein